MEGWVAALRLLGLGWLVVASIGVGLVGGIWLDNLLRVSPLFTLLGLLLGIGLAFISVFRLVAFAFGGRDRSDRGGNSLPPANGQQEEH